MKYTNEHNVPNSICRAIMNDTYDLSRSDLKYLSATTLIDAPRTRLLTARHWSELVTDISENIWRFMGTAVHFAIQQGDQIYEDRIKAMALWDTALPKPRTMIERRFSEQVDGKIVSGRMDYLDPEIEKVIEDYKFTSVWSVIYGKEAWEQQMNVYWWLVTKAGIQVDKLRLVVFCKDWRLGESLGNNDYPVIPIVPMEQKIWGMDKATEYIKCRVALHAKCEPFEDDKIPICSPVERWATGEKWAVMKKGRKSALKLHNSEDDANRHIANMGGGNTFYVEHRPADDKRCTAYCNVNKFCIYYREVYGKNAKTA